MPMFGKCWSEGAALEYSQIDCWHWFYEDNWFRKEELDTEEDSLFLQTRCSFILLTFYSMLAFSSILLCFLGFNMLENIIVLLCMIKQHFISQKCNHNTMWNACIHIIT